MKSLEELNILYTNELQPKLQDMEKLRKGIKLKWTFAALFAICFLFVAGNIGIGWVSTTVAIISVIGVIYFFATGVKAYLNYRSRYKKEVVAQIVKLINPEYRYFPDRCINQAEYHQSQLFTRTPDRYKGDDYVEGRIDKTDFRFSELKTEYKTETTEDGKTRTEWHTIFNGLFFHADFNKHLQGNTFVLPDTAEKLLGKFGQKLQAMSSRGELVKLENPEFEKEFVVYGSSQQEARYVLTPVMMEALVNIRKQFKRKVYVSFTGERVYCAIAFNKGLFEPRVRKSGVKFDDVAEMYQLFSLIEVIITEMNLNTRIWTKE